MARHAKILIDCTLIAGYWAFVFVGLGLFGLRRGLAWAAAITAAQLVGQWLLGLYRSSWQYINFLHFSYVLLGAFNAFIFAFLLLHYDNPLGAADLNWLLVGAAFVCYCAALISHRLVWYFSLNPQSRRRVVGETPIVIYGAGTVAHNLLQDMMDSDLRGQYQIAAVVDNDPDKIGSRLGPYQVNSGKDLARLVRTFDVQEVWFTMPITPEFSQSVLDELHDSIAYRVVPRKFDQLQTEWRKLNVEDLVHRPEIRLSSEPIRDILQGQRVLITGAAGSIGREIARQVLGFSPQRLVLLDQWEQGVFELESEFRGEEAVSSVIVDIQNEDRVWQVISSEKPHTIFHAAAYKHVPLMERNYTEAIKTNVLGTYHLLRCAHRWVSRSPLGTSLQVVNISTDKAVSPENIMGLTKRLSELLIYNMGHHIINQQNLNLDVGASGNLVKTASVRFGNVIGSSGSVVPIFWNQIQNGGPVTVTHPEMERFFMTIPEAVTLVLHALTVSEGDDILALDMGRQVKIVDLAERLIKLAGKIPQKDIKIEFVGIRPGEKLNEELFWTKGSVKTRNPFIFRSQEDLKQLDVRDFVEKTVHALGEKHSLAWWKTFLKQFI